MREKKNKRFKSQNSNTFLDMLSKGSDSADGAWWRLMSLTKERRASIVTLWQRNILFMKREKDHPTSLEHIVTFFFFFFLKQNFLRFLLSFFSQNFHVSVYHDKSLFIFHTKGFLYVKCGKSGVIKLGKKTQKKTTESSSSSSERLFKNHDAALIRSILLSRVSPPRVIAVGPLILHLLIHIHLRQCQNTTSRGQREEQLRFARWNCIIVRPVLLD